MKRLFVCGMTLSLMLWACGDDSSSTGPELSSSSEGVESSSEGIGSSGSQVPVSSETGTSSSAKPGSSSSVPESSSVVPESSATTSGSSAAAGSSSSESETPRQVVNNMAGSCKENNSSGDPMVDGAGGGDWALPPVAFMTVENDSAAYVVQNVRMPCEEIGGFAGMTRQLLKPSLEVTMGDTVMHVTPIVEGSSSSSGCVCSTEFTFKIKLEPPFDQATLLVIDDENNLGNRMRIIKE